LTRNFCQTTLQALASITNQGDLFGLTGASLQACSPAEGDVLASMARWPGLPRGQAALEAALQTVCDSYIRESRATLIAEGIREISAAIDAFSSALYAGASDVARVVCTSEVASQTTPPLSLGEDLLAPGRGAAK
jgi:hypothetical protein